VRGLLGVAALIGPLAANGAGAPADAKPVRRPPGRESRAGEHDRMFIELRELLEHWMVPWIATLTSYSGQ